MISLFYSLVFCITYILRKRISTCNFCYYRNKRIFGSPNQITTWQTNSTKCGSIPTFVKFKPWTWKSSLYSAVSQSCGVCHFRQVSSLAHVGFQISSTYLYAFQELNLHVFPYCFTATTVPPVWYSNNFIINPEFEHHDRNSLLS